MCVRLLAVGQHRIDFSIHEELIRKRRVMADAWEMLERARLSRHQLLQLVSARGNNLSAR